MNSDTVIDIAQEAIKITMLLSAPMLLGAMLIGIVISIFQAITQINEQTLSFVPKIVAIFLLLVLASPWLIETMSNYTVELISNIPKMVATK
jgi:flagellar biosynthetic protein FliQ